MNSAVFFILSLLVILLAGVALYLHEQNQQLRGGLRRLKRELEVRAEFRRLKRELEEKDGN